MQLTPSPPLAGRQRRRVGIASAAGLLLAAGLAAAYARSSPSMPVVLSVSIGILVTLALLARAATGRLDPFEPLVVFGVMWLVMFCLRPLAMLSDGDTSLRNVYDARPALTEALWLALLGGVCFVAGYCVRRVPTVSSRGRAWSRSVWHELPEIPTNVVTLVFGVVGLAATLLSFATGGTANEPSSGYVVFAPLLLLPAVLLLLARRRGRGPLMFGVAVVGAAVLASDFLLVGQRFFGLLPILSVAVLLYLLSHRRPRWFSLGLSLIVLAIALVVLLNQRPGTSGSAQPTSIESVLLNDTTAELPAFSVEMETRDHLWNPRPGYLLYSLAVHWIPKTAIWPTKPESYAEILYAELFPANYSVARDGTEFSVLGDFYYDSGWLGIVVGMAALGVLSRVVFERLIRRSRGDLDAVAYAPVPALVVMMLRGDLTLFFGLVLFIYAPLGVLAIWSRRPEVAVGSRGLEAHLGTQSVNA